MPLSKLKPPHIRAKLVLPDGSIAPEWYRWAVDVSRLINEGGGGGGITTEEAVDAVAAAFAAGSHTGISVSYNDAGNAISLSGATQYTDEMAQDAVAAALAAGTHTNVTVTYNDAANSLSLAASGGSSYTDEQAVDAVAAALANGSHVGISVNYNDAANAISLSTEVGAGTGINAALVLHFDGANGDTTTTDSSGAGVTITAVNSATISTAQSKFGGSSGRAAATTNSRWSTSNTGLRLVGEFTVQFWLRLPNTASGQYFVASKYIAGQPLVWFYTPTSGRVNCYCFGNDIAASPGNVSVNTWHHIAISRDSSNMRRLFIDGALVGSSVLSTNQTTDIGWTIGGTEPSIASTNTEVFIDDFVVVQGQCLYTTGFAVPTVPWGG